MKVIIAGSRTIDNLFLVYTAMTTAGYLHDIFPTEIICGEARGVDKLGRAWGDENDIPVVSFYPEWEKYGVQAGFIRNILMGDYADALVAVWDGSSRGTKQMIDYMKSLGKPTYVRNLGNELP